nr:polymer-forming cytoskeletal protein [Salinadaptatus halalkaliphilus]
MIVVEEDETYDRIEGVGGSIVVYGTVTGDVSGAAGNIHVAEGGTVEGSIAGAAGNININGDIRGDVSGGGGGYVEVGETAQIGGDVAVGSGYLSVDGAIDGNVNAGAETIVLGPNANIGGEFRYDAESFTEDPNATVAGGVVHEPDIGGTVGDVVDVFTVPPWITTIYGLIANLLLGIVLLAAFPSFSSGVATRVADDPLVSGGVGILSMIAIPILLVLVAITIVGIPLAIAGGFGFAIAIWIGVVYGQYAIGTWVLGLAGVGNRWLALMVGLVGFAILSAIPFLGRLLELIAFLLGVGALALGLHKGYRTRHSGRVGGRQTTLEEVASDASTEQEEQS